MRKRKTFLLIILLALSVPIFVIMAAYLSNPCLQRLKRIAVVLNEIWSDQDLVAQIKTPEDYQRILKERLGEPLVCPNTGEPYRFFPKEGIVLADTQIHGTRRVWLAIEWKHKKYGERFQVTTWSPAAEEPKPKFMPSFFRTLFEFIWRLTSWFNPLFHPSPVDCPTNLRNVSMALAWYVQDYDERFPPMKDIAKTQLVLSPYTRNTEIFFCPTTKQPYHPNPHLHHKLLIDIYHPSETPSFYEFVIHPDGLRGVAYADGHFRFVTPSQWQTIQKRYQLPLYP